MMPPTRSAERRGRADEGAVSGRVGRLRADDVRRAAEDEGYCPAMRAAGVEGLRGTMPSTRCTMYGGGTEYGMSVVLDR